MQTTTVSYNPVMSPMAYVINSPIANNNSNAVKSHNSPQMSLEDQMQRLQEENGQLRLKLQAKGQDCSKLRTQVKDLKTELEQYRQLLMQFNQSLTDGSTQSINLALENASAALAAINANKKTAKKKKPANNNNSGCSCCCAAEKPYVCDWANCGKRFRQKPHLEAHKNIHTGRRFICEWTSCGKSFVRKYNLVEHQKLHSSVNSNMCTYPDCGKVFSSKYSLVRHQNAQHNLSL